MQQTRRSLILGGTGAAALAAVGFGTAFGTARARASDGPFEVMMTEAEWRAELTPEEFAVLREEATERAFTSPLNDEKRAGVFVCAGCGNELYSSEHKYDSGTGWPSFWQPIRADAVGTKRDFKLILPRTEVHCARCGGHQGHIFSDGPAPTGLRHCINGIAMDFVPAEA